MKLNINSFFKRIPKWLFWSFLIVIALIILIFNDAFGSSETFGIFAFLYFILLIFLLSRWIFNQIRSVLRLKDEKAKTELLHLKSQVNPHFFFNTLNNLYGLVGKDSKKAQELILKLSDMMRYSIYDGQKEKVALAQEIAYIKNYIELHKMRYYKSIDVVFNHQIANDEYNIMPLLFIILLENAFKHGVENLRENACVHINLRAENNEIFFDIENNFDAKVDTEEVGIGLKNLKRRLEIVYPKSYSLSFSKANAIYKAHLNIKGL